MKIKNKKDVFRIFKRQIDNINSEIKILKKSERDFFKDEILKEDDILFFWNVSILERSSSMEIVILRNIEKLIGYSWEVNLENDFTVPRLTLM